MDVFFLAFRLAHASSTRALPHDRGLRGLKIYSSTGIILLIKFGVKYLQTQPGPKLAIQKFVSCLYIKVLKFRFSIYIYI
jgi:hypothetical protein